MGWERKRGKLVEFNNFITGGGNDAFSVLEGDLPWLRDVRYVITLDADTLLPRGAAAALIGTIAHPLNRAEFDPRRGRVTRGYGILQPRVSVSLASASESRFAAAYAGHPGVDPYTTAVSDVYQDLFGEGTFTGKGIYDVDVFRRATNGRFPDNTLLSHDLIEGAFARAGLVTDVEVYRRLPDSLSHLHAPLPPMDSGRLAAAALVATPCARVARVEPQSVVGALALEDRRQHAAEPHPDRTADLARRRMDDPAGIGVRLDGGHARGLEHAVDRAAALLRGATAEEPVVAALLFGTRA